jgi:hypothetical protein
MNLILVHFLKKRTKTGTELSTPAKKQAQTVAGCEPDQHMRPVWVLPVREIESAEPRDPALREPRLHASRARRGVHRELRCASVSNALRAVVDHEERRAVVLDYVRVAAAWSEVRAPAASKPTAASTGVVVTASARMMAAAAA